MSDEKIPAMHWYKGEWRRDAAVQSLDYWHKGVWFEMLTLMDDMPRGGTWSLDGVEPMPDDAGARLLGLSLEEYRSALAHLRARKVCKVSPSDLRANENVPDGVVYNRKMLRFWDIRQKRAEAGSKGGKQKASNREAEASPSVSLSLSMSKEQPSPDKSEARIVFDYWRETLKHPRSKPSEDKLKKIRARLKEGYTVADCKQAIDGCAGSSWHMGENDRNTVFDSIGLIFRNSEKLEEFMGRAAKPPEKKKGEAPYHKPFDRPGKRTGEIVKPGDLAKGIVEKLGGRKS